MMIDWTTVAKRLGYASEHELWEKLYVQERLPIATISKRFDVSHSTVRDALTRCMIQRRGRGGPNRQEDPRWPEDAAFLEEVQRDGTTLVAARLGFSASAVYKRVRSITRKAKSSSSLP